MCVSEMKLHTEAAELKETRFYIFMVSGYK